MKINPSNSGDNETPGHYSQRRVVVIATGIAAMLLAMSSVWALWKYMPELPVQLPIKEVKFTGDITHTSAVELIQLSQAIVQGSRGNNGGSLLRTDLFEVQATVKQLPWVRNADVRRRFPNGLQIRIEEHLPVAILRADEALLVNSFGEPFKAGLTDDNTAKMPVFIGSPGRSTEILLQFLESEKALIAIGRHVVEVQLSPRDAWRMKLDNGAVLELGRTDSAARLQRFLNAWPEVAAMQTPGAHIDLRYNNGFALSGVSLSAKPKNG